MNGIRRACTSVLAALVAVLPTRAHAQSGDDAPPIVAFTPCEVFQKDRPFTVAARFADESQLFEPKLVYRLVSEKTWKHVNFTREGDAWRATIPKGELTGALAYFVEVFDENGNGPARVGSPETPLFARAVKRAPACPLPGVIALPAAAEEHGTAAEEPKALTTQAETRGFMARCEPNDNAAPFYCKRWVWYAAGGALLATVGIVILATAGGGRDYPDRVDFEVRSQGLELR